MERRVSRTDADADKAASVAAGAIQPACETLDEVHARRGLLLRLAYRFCWNDADAEDAVQNALLLASEREHQLSDRGKLWSWVRSIVVRQCKELLRRGVRRSEVESMLEPRTKEVHDSLTGFELSGMVKELIKTLPERQQTALILRHLEDMSYAEIAEMMRITESTARVQVRNARESLREAIAEKSPDWAAEPTS